MNASLLKRIPLHPFIMAVYPILSLWVNNLNETQSWDAVRSILFSLFVAGASLVGLRLILRDWIKAGLIVTLIQLLVFSYGHVYGIIEDIQIVTINLGRHRLLAGTWLAFMVFGAWWIIRRKESLANANQAINLIAIVLIIFPAIQAFQAQGSQRNAARGFQTSTTKAQEIALQLSSLPLGETPPDIYYIILDAYTRDDTLSTYFKYDNQPFIQALEQLGFFVARCSQSNYSKTQLSLASSLNMNYIDAFGLDERSVTSETELNFLLANNAVRQTLKRLGYQIVVIESGFSPTEWVDSDTYLTMNRDFGNELTLFRGINPFEALLLRTSAGLLLFEIKPWLPHQVRSFLDTAYMQHRDRILFAFNELEAIPSMIPGPKFVFVHILAPHEPFVFGPRGELVERQTPFALNNDADTRDIKTYRRGYRDQINYLNSRITPVLAKIIETSPSPPIIILQGDHGSLLRASSINARMTILNAYFLPGNGQQKLYHRITPVNSFRVIFDLYFGSSLGLLPDKSYFFDNDQDHFILSPNVRPGCE